MLQECWQGLHAVFQGRVLRFHLSAQPWHHCHGWVECVPVHLWAVFSYKGQHAVETACIKHSPRFSCADELQHLKSANSEENEQQLGSRLHGMLRELHGNNACNTYKLFNMQSPEISQQQRKWRNGWDQDFMVYYVWCSATTLATGINYATCNHLHLSHLLCL